MRAQLAEADITVGPVHRNLPAPELIARSLARGEGIFAANGALVVTTGERTGRSPADRYIVDEPEATGVAWGGANQPCTPEFFDRQVRRVSDYLRRREVYVFDGFIGAEPTYRTPIRVVARASWHGLFAHTLFVRPEPIDLEDFEPAFTVIECGELPVDARPAEPDDADTGPGDRPSPVFVGICLSRRLVIILGTMYGGEMKKALFTAMNYLLPERSVAHNIFLGREPSAGGVLDIGRMNQQAEAVLKEIGVDKMISPTAIASSLSVAEEQLVEIVNAISFTSQSRIASSIL